MKKPDINPTQRGTIQKRNQNNESLPPGLSQGLHVLFGGQLMDIYSAEKALISAIPRMIKYATTEELVKALKFHLEETNEHVARLEEVFTSFGEKPKGKRCKAIEGFMSEAEELIQNSENDMIRDVAIISACQKIEHYEMATYGTLCSWARTLGESDAASLLQDSLEEEIEANQVLSEIAESHINAKTTGDEEENMDEKEDDEDDINLYEVLEEAELAEEMDDDYI